MSLSRQPAQRPIPVERAIRWLPLDDPFYMLATVLVTAKSEPLFVSREVLVSVETHLRTGAEGDALGILYGANYFCSKTRMAYLLVEGAERASIPSHEHDRDAEMAAELRSLARRVEASGKLVIGWYHGGADITPRIGLREIGLHLAVCSEPWQVALLRSGTATEAPRRGAFARVEPTERRVYPIPFVELLPRPSRNPTSRSSAVSWTNYRSEASVALLPDSAFEPTRASGPISSRSRLSLLGALHDLIGGAPEAEPAAPAATPAVPAPEVETLKRPAEPWATPATPVPERQTNIRAAEPPATPAAKAPEVRAPIAEPPVPALEPSPQQHDLAAAEPDASDEAAEQPAPAAQAKSREEPQHSTRALPFTPPEGTPIPPTPRAEREVAIAGRGAVPADAAPPAEAAPPVLPSSPPAPDSPVEASASAPTRGIALPRGLPPFPALPATVRGEIAQEKPVPESDGEPVAAAPVEGAQEPVWQWGTTDSGATDDHTAAPKEPVSDRAPAPDAAVPPEPDHTLEPVELLDSPTATTTPAATDEPVHPIERPVDLPPLPLADAPEQAEAVEADEPPHAPESARPAASEPAHPDALDLRYPATRGASTTHPELPVDIARIFESAPDDWSEEPDPEPEPGAHAMPSQLADYLHALQRPRVRARVIAAAVVLLGLASVVALLARQHTRDASAETAPETSPVSADTAQQQRNLPAPATKSHAYAPDTGAAAMQHYARTRLASETSALAADVASLGTALQVVLGPAPRTSTDSLRHSLACARADSARTDAIMHGQAVQLARRYLTTPSDAPAVARAAALAARADTLTTALRAPCPPES